MRNWKVKGVKMLVLSRNPGERIKVGDDVIITIVRIGPNSVRVGIDAPKTKSIVREELVERNGVRERDDTTYF